MRFRVIFRARSRERSQRTSGPISEYGVASRCEIEPRITKQYKCQYCCSFKNYRGKGMGGGKKSVFASFFSAGWPAEDREFVAEKNWCVLGRPIARATRYCLFPDALWLQASKNAFKVGCVKFANSLSPPSTGKKVRTGSESSRAKAMPGKSQGS